MSNKSNQVGNQSGPKSVADQMNVMQEQLNELTADRDRMAEQNANLHARVDQAESQSAPDVMSSNAPTVTKDNIQQFLNFPRPLCEYFNLTLCTYQMAVFHDAISDINKVTGVENRLPMLWMEMTRWRGPGAEFPATNHLQSDKFQRIGYWNAATSSQLVQVLEGDIKEYNLLHPDAPDHSKEAILRFEAPYTIQQVVDKIQQTDDYRRGVIISGAAFQLAMKATYEKKWAGEEIDKTLRDKMAQYTPNAMKAGLPALSGVGK